MSIIIYHHRIRKFIQPDGGITSVNVEADWITEAYVNKDLPLIQKLLTPPIGTLYARHRRTRLGDKMKVQVYTNPG